MKNYVITMRSNAMSVGAAGRCINSGRMNNMKIEIFDAVTPSDDPVEMAESLGLNIDGFHNDQFYSRYENCVAAFMSHFSYGQCVTNNKKSLQSLNMMQL